MVSQLVSCPAFRLRLLAACTPAAKTFWVESPKSQGLGGLTEVFRMGIHLNKSRSLREGTPLANPCSLEWVFSRFQQACYSQAPPGLPPALPALLWSHQAQPVRIPGIRKCPMVLGGILTCSIQAEPCPCKQNAVAIEELHGRNSRTSIRQESESCAHGPGSNSGYSPVVCNSASSLITLLPM